MIQWMEYREIQYLEGGKLNAIKNHQDRKSKIRGSSCLKFSRVMRSMSFFMGIPPFQII